MRALVTGSLGAIGRVLATGLAERGHEVIGADIAAGADHTVDCADPDAVASLARAVRPEAIVHLAGIPDETSLPDALSSHALTTAAIAEAAVETGVPRIVYASSNHAVGRTPATGPHGDPILLRADAAPRPDTFYGVAKVTAEAILRLYADRHGIDAICCRIGSFGERPETRRQLSTWLSPGDCVAMFDAALTAPAPGFAVLYGISANSRAWWDLEPGRAVGYHPADDAEDFADQIESTPATLRDRAEAANVGGPFATAAFERPAF